MNNSLNTSLRRKTMLQKNIDRQERKKRDTWVGYYPRRTPTKKTLMDRQEKKHKNKQALSPTKWRGDFYLHFNKFSYKIQEKMAFQYTL